MATANAASAARIEKEVSRSDQFKTFIGRYFYLCMSLVMATLVVAGFSRTVNNNLLHAAPARPLLLWIHAAAFSTWVVFFIAQSALVRVRKVNVHRFIGWFGAALAAVMVTVGVVVAVVMARFDSVVLHQPDTDAFLSVPFEDMLVFGSCVGLAIYWRKNPEFHRRLIFIATCQLMDAAIARYEFWFDHNLFYPALDVLIVLGMTRDWWVDGRVHKVYRYALPILMVVQGTAVYLWRANPGWWQGITSVIMGW